MVGDLGSSKAWSLYSASFLSRKFLLLPPQRLLLLQSSVSTAFQQVLPHRTKARGQSRAAAWFWRLCHQPREHRLYLLPSKWVGSQVHPEHNWIGWTAACPPQFSRALWHHHRPELQSGKYKSSCESELRTFQCVWTWMCLPHRILLGYLVPPWNRDPLYTISLPRVTQGWAFFIINRPAVI